LRRELELLWEFHGRRLKVGTPPERLADRLAFTQRPPLRLAYCSSCQLVWRNPAEAEAELRAGYEEDAIDHDVLDALHATQRSAYDAQAQRLTRSHRGTGEVLEIGSYVGGFLAAAGALGWRATGVDINRHTNDFTRGLRLEVIDGDISDVDPSRRWDAIVAWNCLDQLSDPRDVVRQACGRLRTGGTFAARVPNGGVYARRRFSAEAVGTRAAVSRGVLAQNNLLGFPYRWGFTPHSLARLLESVGLRINGVVGDVLVPLADEWTRPWARAEERLTKAAMRALARVRPNDAPWFEIYASKI
jgi:SAM-dependent methyltransferase